MARNQDDFNSSDIELDLGPKRTRHTIKSVQRIIEDADHDRLQSKAALKSLEFGRGSPGTLYHQDLWVERFNAFRVAALKQSIEQPFTGSEIIRFFDSQIDKMKRPCVYPPNEKTILRGFEVLSSYGTFTYPPSTGYRLTPHDAERFATWKDRAVKANRLFRGRSSPIVALTFTIASRMVREFLAHFLKHGTTSWNRIISRVLGIVLVVGCASRAGDISRTNVYRGIEYAKYKDFVITLDIDGKTVLDLTAVFTLEWVKCFKDRINENRPVFFSALRNPNHVHMCPITTLLSHARRHGLVRGGNTIEEIIEYTAGRPDRTIQWEDPNLPILPAFNNRDSSSVLLDHPAAPAQLLDTTKMMGLISGILGKVQTKFFRFGAAKDVAHISVSSDANAGRHTRQVLGHSIRSTNSGVTDGYIDTLEIDHLTPRVEAEFRSRRSVKFGDQEAMSIVKAPVTAAQIEQWLQENSPSESLVMISCPKALKNLKKRVADKIEKERHEEFLATAQPEPRWLTSSEVNVRSSLSTCLNTKASMRKSVQDDESAGSVSQPLENSAVTDAGTTLQDIDETPIDPRLLDTNAIHIDDMDDNEVNCEEVESLATDLLGCSGERFTDQEVIAMQTSLVDHVDDESGSPLEAAMSFIHTFSSINVIRNTAIADVIPSRFENDHFEIPLVLKYTGHIPRGHSLDPPTLFVHRCRVTSGCKFATHIANGLTSHEAGCSEARVEMYARKQYACTYTGCTKKFTLLSHMQQHLKDHIATKPCPHCENPDKTYGTGALIAHITKHHSGRWPTLCLVEVGCSNGETFKFDRYQKHLTDHHQLTTAAARKPYQPVDPSPKLTKHLVNGPCSVNSCTTKVARSSTWKKHLMVVHKMSEAEADSMLESRYAVHTRAERAQQIISKNLVTGPCSLNGCTTKVARSGVWREHLMAVYKMSEAEADGMLESRCAVHTGAERAQQTNSKRKLQVYQEGLDNDDNDDNDEEET